MSKTTRTAIALFCLLLTLSSLGLTIFAITIPHLGMTVSMGVMTVLLGLFNYHDYKFFFGKKNEPTKPV